MTHNKKTILHSIKKHGIIHILYMFYVHKFAYMTHICLLMTRYNIRMTRIRMLQKSSGASRKQIMYACHINTCKCHINVLMCHIGIFMCYTILKGEYIL